MNIDTAYTAHLGGRDEQQDAVTVLDRPDSGDCLVVLADGMGGHAGGSLASRTVVETAERIWRDGSAPAEPRDLLAHICQSAHDAINKAGEEQNLSPRSTCVLLLLRDGKAHWAHIGDSRLYRFRDGAQLGRTRDHSVVQMLLDMGKITEEEMGTHPDQNRLTQSLGGDTDPEPDFGSDEARDGDGFILCSDGLWEMVRPEEMAEALTSKTLGTTAESLASEAFDRAGRHSDNISVAMVRLGGPAVAAAAHLGDATTLLAGSAAAAAPSRRRSAGAGRLAIAFVFVGVLAVGAAAAVVRPWEQGDPFAASRSPEPVNLRKADPAPAPKAREPDATKPADPKPGTTDTNPRKDAARQPGPPPNGGRVKPVDPGARPEPDARRQPPGETPKTAPGRMPRTAPDSQRKPQTHTPADPQAKPGPDPAPKADPKAEPGAPVTPKTEIPPKTDAQPKTEAQPRPEVRPDSETRPQPQADPKPEVRPTPDGQRRSETRPAPQGQDRPQTDPKSDSTATPGTQEPTPELMRPGNPRSQTRFREPETPPGRQE